jgi:hypothetical protein
MKKVLYPLCVASILATGSAQAAGPTNSIRAAALINPIGNVRMVEYEKMFADKVSIGARVGALSYDYDDGDYEEEGDGTGAEFLVRLYPGGDGFKGFYFGGAVGYWKTDWEWREDFWTPAGVWIEGKSESLNLNVGVGWKIPLAGNKLYIDPSITIGNYFDLDSETDAQWRGTVYDDENEELGFYVAGGIAVGFNF